MSRLRSLALATLAVALLAVAGCGGGGSTDDRVSGLTAAEILRQSTAAADGLTAFTLAGNATVQARVAGGALPALVNQALAESVKVQGSGPVNGASASIDFDATLPGLPTIQGNVTKVDGSLYAGILGTDYKVDLPEGQVAAIVPAELVAGLLGWATAPVEAGRETIDGTATVHLTAKLDLDAVLEDVSGAVAAIGGSEVSPATLRRSEAQLRAAVTERAMDLWIGVEDLVPRRITARLRFAGRVDALPQLRTGSLDLDMRFSKIGEEVAITAPATTEVLDLGRLRSLAGG
jgi:hypothetical protein